MSYRFNGGQVLKYCCRARLIGLLTIFLLPFEVSSASFNQDSPKSSSSDEINQGFIESWKLFGPGDADQVTSLTIVRNGDVFLGTDVGGLYKSVDSGESWYPINSGIKNYDITTPVVQSSADANILFVGTRGGLYKSVDGGVSWRNIRNGLPSLQGKRLVGSIGSVIIDPNNSRLVYVGLGYRPSSDGTRTVREITWSDSIFRSMDGGELWERITVFPKRVKIYQLTASRRDVGRIYAATSDGLYTGYAVSGNWRKLNEKETFNFAYLDDEERVFIATSGSRGVFRSDDAGKHWVSINEGLGFWPHFSGPNRYSVLAVGAQEQIYVVNSTWGSSGGLYSLRGKGSKWNYISADLPESWLAVSRRMNAVAVSQQDSDLIFLGSSRYVYRSRDAGRNWEQLISRRNQSGWTHRGLNVFGHTRDIVVNPKNPSELFVATADHGIVNSIDRGISWNSLSDHPKYSDTVLDLEFCDDGRKVSLYAASRDIKGNSCISVSVDEGGSWTSACRELMEGTVVMQVLADSRNCDDVLIATNTGLYHSESGGKLWERLFPKASEQSANVLSIARSQNAGFMVGTDEGLYQSKDAGRRWTPLLPDKFFRITSILASDDGVILVGAEDSRYGESSILRSLDGGQAWKAVLSGLHKYVSGFAQLPASEKVIYAATNDHNYHDESQGSGVFRSEDSGSTWASVNSGLPVLRAWGISTSDRYPWRIFLSSNGSGSYFLRDRSAPSD